MKNTTNSFTLKSLAVGLSFLATALMGGASEDCNAAAKRVAKQVTSKPGKVLSIVSASIAANEDCACEIVKAAIIASEADKNQVAQIVERAVQLASDKASLIKSCALAVAPDAHAEIAAVVAKHLSQEVAKYDGVSASKSEERSGQSVAGDEFIDPLGFVGIDGWGLFQSILLELPPTLATGVAIVSPGTVYTR